MHKINIRSFDLNLLSVFVVLWDTRSVTRASDRLALTQPAVSHALRRMRDAVGDDLFVNAKGGLVPTARCEALIGPVREALEKIGLALQEEETFVPSLAQREFNIAAGDLIEFSIVPQLVEQLGKDAPGIVVRMTHVPEGDLALQLLESGELDVIMSGQPLKGMGVHNETLAEITIATLVWKQEKLRSRRFPLDLYLKRPHVIIQMPPRQESIVDQTLANLGLQRPVGAVVQNFMLYLQCAEPPGRRVCRALRALRARAAGRLQRHAALHVLAQAVRGGPGARVADAADSGHGAETGDRRPV
jgi:DNA-binding transcriptional LysR family regulator